MAYTGQQPKTGQIAGLVYKELGKGTASANQAITSTVSPGTDITGLSVTATPDGTHDARTLMSIPNPSKSDSSWSAPTVQKDGTQVTFGFLNGNNLTGTLWQGNFNVQFVDTPTAVSHTMKGSAYVSTGTFNTLGTTPCPASIVYEQIG